MQKKNEKSQQGMFKSYAGDKQEVELKIQKKIIKWNGCQVEVPVILSSILKLNTELLPLKHFLAYEFKTLTVIMNHMFE